MVLIFIINYNYYHSYYHCHVETHCYYHFLRNFDFKIQNLVIIELAFHPKFKKFMNTISPLLQNGH